MPPFFLQLPPLQRDNLLHGFGNVLVVVGAERVKCLVGQVVPISTNVYVGAERGGDVVVAGVVLKDHPNILHDFNFAFVDHRSVLQNPAKKPPNHDQGDTENRTKH